MFEHRNEKLISKAKFIERQIWHTLIAIGIVAGSLLIGIVGYHFLEGLSWLDSLVNSAMLLGGMGPVNQLYTNSGKLFAAFYALYSGIVFLVVAGVLFAPVFHRFLHHFHLEIESDDAQDGTPLSNNDE